jgi:hypothetical protein
VIPGRIQLGYKALDLSQIHPMNLLNRVVHAALDIVHNSQELQFCFRELLQFDMLPARKVEAMKLHNTE